MPRTRSSDPFTSHEAAASVTPNKLSWLKREIMYFAQGCDAFCDVHLVIELMKMFPHECSPSGIRSRRKELIEEGQLEQSMINGKPDTITIKGRRHLLWRVKKAEQAKPEGAML